MKKMFRCAAGSHPPCRRRYAAVSPGEEAGIKKRVLTRYFCYGLHSANAAYTVAPEIMLLNEAVERVGG